MCVCMYIHTSTYLRGRVLSTQKPNATLSGHDPGFTHVDVDGGLHGSTVERNMASSGLIKVSGITPDISHRTSDDPRSSTSGHDNNTLTPPPPGLINTRMSGWPAGCVILKLLRRQLGWRYIKSL